MRCDSKRIFFLDEAASFLIATALAVAPAAAQHVTGTLGQPSATTTIDGKQLPAPPLKYGGVIRESARIRRPGGRLVSCRPRGAQCAPDHDR